MDKVNLWSQGTAHIHIAKDVERYLARFGPVTTADVLAVLRMMYGKKVA